MRQAPPRLAQIDQECSWKLLSNIASCPRHLFNVVYGTLANMHMHPPFSGFDLNLQNHSRVNIERLSNSNEGVMIIFSARRCHSLSLPILAVDKNSNTLHTLGPSHSRNPIYLSQEAAVCLEAFKQIDVDTYILPLQHLTQKCGPLVASVTFAKQFGFLSVDYWSPGTTGAPELPQSRTVQF